MPAAGVEEKSSSAEKERAGLSAGLGEVASLFVDVPTEESGLRIVTAGLG